ncbi:hypothetical protein I4U23_029041, partial [Adineta vaga]
MNQHYTTATAIISFEAVTESTPPPTQSTLAPGTTITTSVICPLIDGMTNPQYINQATFIGAPGSTTVSELNPESPGVNFINNNASVIIPFTSGTTPILSSVSVPSPTTNVDSITVIVKQPDGTVLFSQTSPSGTPTVAVTYNQPLPEGSTVTIIFNTPNGAAPTDVTVSIIACYTPSTATTVVTTGTVPPTISGSTPSITITTVTGTQTQTTGVTGPTPPSTQSTLAPGTPTTTTVICPLIDGMTNPQYINQAIFIGAPGSTTVSELNPESPGVNFINNNASVIIPFTSGTTPILSSVSVPSPTTNVDSITVIVKKPDGTVLFSQTSPSGTPTVDVTYNQPLPEGSTVTIIFNTPNGAAPTDVTVSIIACYAPSTATTVVTTGTVPPTISGSTPSITITTLTTVVTQGTTATGSTAYPGSTGVTGSTQAPTQSTLAPGTPTTTTVICPLIDGMTNPQYINQAIFIGAPGSTTVSELNPESPGVNFINNNASVIIPFTSGTTPILSSVSVPSPTTNVDSITVIVKQPDGTVLFSQTSPSGTPTVAVTYNQPLPEGSTVTIIFNTPNGAAPTDVTVSIIACYTPSTATTVVTTGTVPPTISGSTPSITITTVTGTQTQTTGVTGSTPPPPTQSTLAPGTPTTTTVICPLIDGMTNPQYINQATFIGAPASTTVSELNPESPGVNFINNNASVIIPFTSGTTPILSSVSVPSPTTNVDSITVIVKQPDGTVLFSQTSPSGTPTVAVTYNQPLPEGSTVTIIFNTPNGAAPTDVTVSIIACYTPSTATTVVTTGTVSPTVFGSTPSITISTLTAGQTQTTSVTGSTPPPSTQSTFAPGTPTTTTVICPLIDGMTNPQYINQATFIGAPASTTVSELNPESPGVNFINNNASVIIP